jgi:hypothetical protein
MSIPTPVNPLLDDTGKLCMIGQQGSTAGVFDSVHDGHFALIPPLARGTHVVRAVGGRSVDGLGFDVIYRLHIVRPRQHVPLP